MAGDGHDVDLTFESPPKKKLKTYQNYMREYSLEHKFIARSKKGEHFACCCIYDVDADLSIKCGGSHDIKRHVATKKHQENVNLPSNFQST